MNLKQMIERVQLHHPHMSEAEIVIRLNEAKDSFCEETEIVKTNFTFNTIANQRFYTMTPQILKILNVQFNDTIIPRLVEEPLIYDDTSETN